MEESKGLPPNKRGRFRRLLDRRPTRRQVLESAALVAVAGTVGSVSPQNHPQAFPGDLSPFQPRLRVFRDRLHDKARGWIMAGVESITRPAEKKEDSFVYTVDVAQLMEHFAAMADIEPYLKLRDFAVKHLIINKLDDPYTRGFVLWKCVPDTTPDASGTTEALRVAKALWAGGNQFNRPEDKETAVMILGGYLRHANTDQGIWLIRNYFGFGTRSFANNTFVIDYDADFIRTVADASKGDASRYDWLSKLADNSYTLMRRTKAPTGLLYDLVQPELKTMYWGLDVTAFSPNDVIQTNNACTTAATIAVGAPEMARSLLSFLVGKFQANNKLHQYYYGRTGEAVNNWGLGSAETASVVRLAALLGDRVAVATFIQTGLVYWESVSTSADASQAWGVSELLMGLRAAIALGN